MKTFQNVISWGWFGCRWLASMLVLGPLTGLSMSQTKPTRSLPPSFRAGQFEGIFFAEPAAQLQGTVPDRTASTAPASGATAQNAQPSSSSATNAPAADGDQGWKELISPTSLEDLIKGGKLRLDKIVTTPAAFKAGGFVAARTEFSLQAVLFAVIETYPGEVRWKNHAAVARERFARVAANTKVGSDQVFAEAKARLLDLGDLLGGAPLEAATENSRVEVEWSNLIDRVPLMQLLDWAQDQNLNKLIADERVLSQESDAVLRYAELVSVLGKIALTEEMPDANDDDYRTLAEAMIEQARQIGVAVRTNNPEVARRAAAVLGQSCTNCHDSYR